MATKDDKANLIKHLTEKFDEASLELRNSISYSKRNANINLTLLILIISAALFYIRALIAITISYNGFVDMLTNCFPRFIITFIFIFIINIIIKNYITNQNKVTYYNNELTTLHCKHNASLILILGNKDDINDLSRSFSIEDRNDTKTN